MNTVFFEKASDITKDFSWKDIFADTFKPHTKEQRAALLTKGIGNNIPAPSQMLKQWQKPWLFFWIGIVGIVISVFSLISWNIFSSSAMGVVLFMIPAFVMPLTALIFYWEMDITGSISIFETLLMMLLGGLLSLTVTGILRVILTLPDAAYILGPLPEEIAKFAIVWILLSRRKYNYGLQGILIGGAVGVGFSAMESAGYAWDAFEYALAAANQAGLGAYTQTFVTQKVTNTIIIRGFLAIGGHVVWAALYGGALGLLKGRGKMRAGFLGDPSVIMTFSGAVLLHTLWNLDSDAFVGVFPASIVNFISKLDRLFIVNILLTIAGWMLLFFIMRKCIRQAVAVAGHSAPVGAIAGQPHVQGGMQPRPVGRMLLTVAATGKLNHGQEYKLAQGSSLVFGRDKTRANVAVPSDTKGVSAVHCEIKVKEGFLVLIDRNSTYGTFFSDGTRLKPNVPYKLKDSVKFYLASEDNQFVVRMHGN